MPNHAKHAARMQAAELPMMLGMPIETEPHDGLMQAVWLMAGAVDYCSHRIALLSTPDELALPEPSTVMKYWLGLRRAALDDFTRSCKLAIDAGVSERTVRIAETLGAAVGDTLRDVIEALGLTAEQRAKADEIVPLKLQLLASKVAA